MVAVPVPDASSPRVTVVVGNPRPASRTRVAAEAVARELARLPGLDGAAVETLELSTVATELFDPSSAAVAAMVEQVRTSDAVVVASPVYKATYTGLLKSFLDWFSRTSLSGVLAVPAMVGAAAVHALAVEDHLRPLLVEIGGSVPTRGLFVLETQIPEIDEVVRAWREDAGPALGMLRLGRHAAS